MRKCDDPVIPDTVTQTYRTIVLLRSELDIHKSRA